MTGTNRWDLLDPPETGNWKPRLRASVVIPYYDSLPKLRRTLVGLSAQTYPADLTEIIVVDDGSPEPLETTHLDSTIPVRIINRPDEGFRLAAARNDGAQAASGDVVVFLDHDMIPDPVWLESHMRWHHVSRRALVLGARSHVDSGWLTETMVRDAVHDGGLHSIVGDREVQVPEWIEFHLRRTANLTSGDEDIFRVVTGGNMSVSREFFHSVGGFDPSFVRWGGEDTEFGYRAWVSGALLVPDGGAHCWHQGLGVVPDPEERDSQDLQRAKLAHLIPVPGFRPPTTGRIWKRPRVVAEVVGDDPTAMLSSARALLEIPDVAVVVRSDAPLLLEDLGPDPRVTIDPSTEEVHSFSPFHAIVPEGLTVSGSLMDTLVERARQIGSASTDDGVTVQSRRHQAAGELTEVSLGQRAGRGRVEPTAARRVLRRLGRIRSIPDAARTARWALEAGRRRVGRGRRGSSGGFGRVGVSRPHRLVADPWSRIVAIDAPSLPATGTPDGHRVDLVVEGGSTKADFLPDAPRLRVAETENPDLLRCPPLDGHQALLALLGETDDTDPRLQLLAGQVPGDTAPGHRTQAALSLAASRDPGDIAALEAIRRAVLTEHLEPMRLDQLRVAAGLRPSAPSVSVVLTSRRRDLLPVVVEAIGRQSYPYRELIVALHGIGVPEALGTVLSETGMEAEIFEAPAEMTFGTVLAMASERASGQLIAKMDDDDLYSCSHLEDLVLAHMLSGADLVGKGAEFVYFQESDTTIRRFIGGAYSDSHTIAGGAMAITRDAYQGIGGWADLPRHVDHALIRDVTTSGGKVFRTHGLGYVLVRHDNHTWHSDEARFLGQAEERWPGLPDWIVGAFPPDACDSSIRR